MQCDLCVHVDLNAEYCQSFYACPFSSLYACLSVSNFPLRVCQSTKGQPAGSTSFSCLCVILQMTSVQRIFTYIQLESEKETSCPIEPSEDWPQHGGIAGENVTFRYSDDGAVVLSDLRFKIQPGEKVRLFDDASCAMLY